MFIIDRIVNQTENGEAYYEYILVYNDDVLAISHDPT